MNKRRALAAGVEFISVWVVLAAVMTEVWLTEEVRVLSLAILPPAIVAVLLVLYFDWRGRFARRLGTDDRHDREIDATYDRAA